MPFTKDSTPMKMPDRNSPLRKRKYVSACAWGNVKPIFSIKAAMFVFEIRLVLGAQSRRLSAPGRLEIPRGVMRYA